MANAETATLGWIYRWLLRPWLFFFSAEAAHSLAERLLRVLHRNRRLRWLLGRRARAGSALHVDVLGRRFESPIGMAAGFDKHARTYNALAHLGFGFVEVGTITAHEQSGNPRPRLFRLPADRALINRMGFNNCGAVRAAENLGSAPPERAILGVNIGKSRVTPVESAADDYAFSVRHLARFAHYLAVNVSSPNTPGLRSLQSVDALRPVLNAVLDELAAQKLIVPVLVKIAPDLADDDIDAVVDLALELGLAGIIACNTTISRDGLHTKRMRVDAIGAGGLSGPVLARRAREVVSRVYSRAKGRLVVVGVGGVTTADDAWELLRAGASLVQIYTGFVYEGPRLVERIHRGLLAKMCSRKLASISEIVGEAAEVSSRPYTARSVRQAETNLDPTRDVEGSV